MKWYRVSEVGLLLPRWTEDLGDGARAVQGDGCG